MVRAGTSQGNVYLQGEAAREEEHKRQVLKEEEFRTHVWDLLQPFSSHTWVFPPCVFPPGDSRKSYM